MGQFKLFSYSFHEIVVHDVSVMIDYILSTTGVERLTYVGHSMGGAAFMVAMSIWPEYNSKISQFIGLAPAVFLGNTTSPLNSFVPMFLKSQVSQHFLVQDAECDKFQWFNSVNKI